jgi:hypothetical protein
MSTIAPEKVEIYCIHVVTTAGDRWEVDGYVMYRLSRCKCLADNLRQVLAREYPLPTDPAPMREMWHSLFEFGIDPSACTVHVVRQSDDAGPHAENGWEVVN